jgi:hypothetical protein
MFFSQYKDLLITQGLLLMSDEPYYNPRNPELASSWLSFSPLVIDYKPLLSRHFVVSKGAEEGPL